MPWWIWLVFCMVAEEPVSQWQVSVRPDIALVRSNGQSVMIKGAELYIYDNQGTPLRNVTLAFAPDRAFVGPQDYVWVHDGEGLLGRLNDNYNLAWQREMVPPTVPPFIFGDLLAFAGGNDVFLLTPENGNARYSRRTPRPVSGLASLDEWLLISDGGKWVLAWAPATGLEQTRYEDKGDLRFAERAPTGEVALTFPKGRIEVTYRGIRSKWRRDHHIDIAVPPIWLYNIRRPQLLVATRGRRVTAYGINGRILASHLLKNRVAALIPFHDNRVLVIPEESAGMIWYHGEKRNFITEDLPETIRFMAFKGEYVLLVDYSGMVRLYKTTRPGT
ncbi:MAG: hypothetical protein QNK37_23730 [Acidobacteriota bacterium]|nr:hypothetical protein [Acidobacteriota bacterium]